MSRQLVDMVLTYSVQYRTFLSVPLKDELDPDGGDEESWDALVDKLLANAVEMAFDGPDLNRISSWLPMSCCKHVASYGLGYDSNLLSSINVSSRRRTSDRHSFASVQSDLNHLAKVSIFACFSLTLKAVSEP